MRRIFLAFAIFALIGPVPGTVQHLPVDDDSQIIRAQPLRAPAKSRGALRFVRGWALESPHSRFGGFSALAMGPGGEWLLVGDNGYRTRFALAADGTVSHVDIAPLPVPAGQSRRKSMVDAEALAVDPATGQAWLALEGINQVWRLDAALSAIRARAKLPGKPWPANSGAEAMVRLSDGRTILFSESARDDSRGSEALLFEGDPTAPGAQAVRFFYDARGKGRVSDAAPLPDGRLLLVHRRLGFHPVFTTILAVVDPAEIAKDAVVRSRTLGRVPTAIAENYEGAVVTAAGGRSFLWLVSDNNLNRWQRTLLVQFELTGLPPAPAADSKKAAP